MLALLRQRRRLLPYSGSYSIRDPKEECGWRDLNPHGCPPAPKAGASASSATSAWSPIESHYSVFEKNCQLRFCLIRGFAFSFWGLCILYKICCQVVLLTTVTPLDPNAHKVPPVLSFCLFSYAVFDSFYIDPIHLFGIGSVLLSLSADHLWRFGLHSFG